MAHHRPPRFRLQPGERLIRSIPVWWGQNRTGVVTAGRILYVTDRRLALGVSSFRASILTIVAGLPLLLLSLIYAGVIGPVIVIGLFVAWKLVRTQTTWIPARLAREVALADVGQLVGLADDEVLEGEESAQIVDARAAPRFEGAVAEPRPGLRSGHIPGSRNLPSDQLTDPATRTVLSPDRLAERFAAAGIDPARPVVASCGSGVTACVLAFGLHLLGRDDVAVYDGSWSEWGLPGTTPVETGPAR